MRTTPSRSRRVLQHHRTVDRITRILQTVVYRPGITFSELARALDAPKGSVHGFISGLLAAGWLYEQDHRFYLGPAVYALRWSAVRSGPAWLPMQTWPPCTKRLALLCS
jgi:IclR-like helix-turn-helix domain-containing protein